MHDLYFYWVFLVASFVLAGLVKGVTGMGLPTVAMGLMGVLMPPAAAAAMLVIPSLVTNVWQACAGGQATLLMRRFAWLLLAIALASAASAQVLVRANPVWSGFALGVALLVYALYALLAPPLLVPPRWERWLSPLVGALTGVITGVTGVFVMPVVPYLQSLGLDKQALVQMLGLSFTVSTLALGAGLWWQGAFAAQQVGLSFIVLVPALLGMWLGQRIRARISAQRFKQVFLGLLAVLGLQLALRPWL